jgi:aromatic ring-opening dioxygenase catalytic subunit (LigB family)
MRQIEREYGIDYGFLWSLRYRRERLRTISISVYESIRAAYRAECGRQMRKLENEISRTEKIAGPDHHLVASARAVVDAAKGE